MDEAAALLGVSLLPLAQQLSIKGVRLYAHLRERLVVRRTAVITQIRGLLLELGITMRKGREHLEASLPAFWKTQTTNYQVHCEYS